MTSTFRLAAAAGLTLFAYALPVGAQDQLPARPPVGGDRWAVKTGADLDAHKVKLTPQKSTIEKLLALTRPKSIPLVGEAPAFQEKRVEPVETSTFTVEADLAQVRLMPDGDYRVVIQGASGKQIVLEMPDPDPTRTSPNSPFLYGIKSAREALKSRITPETTQKAVKGHLRVTGIGFFSRAWGKNKPDGNMIQLHPVLQVEWLDEPTAEFKAAAAHAQKASEPKAPPAK